MASFKEFLEKYFPHVVKTAYPSAHLQAIAAAVDVHCHGEAKPKSIVAHVLPSPGRHLVIVQIRATAKCPTCGKPKLVANFYQGRTFRSLIEAETYRSSIKRTTPNEARIISNARACQWFVELASNRSIIARLAEGEFLAKSFEAAKSPQFN